MPNRAARARRMPRRGCDGRVRATSNRSVDAESPRMKRRRRPPGGMGKPPPLGYRSYPRSEHLRWSREENTSAVSVLAGALRRSLGAGAGVPERPWRALAEPEPGPEFLCWVPAGPEPGQTWRVPAEPEPGPEFPCWVPAGPGPEPGRTCWGACGAGAGTDLLGACGAGAGAGSHLAGACGAGAGAGTDLLLGACGAGAGGARHSGTSWGQGRRGLGAWGAARILEGARGRAEPACSLPGACGAGAIFRRSLRRRIVGIANSLAVPTHGREGKNCTGHRDVLGIGEVVGRRLDRVGVQKQSPRRFGLIEAVNAPDARRHHRPCRRPSARTQPVP